MTTVTDKKRNIFAWSNVPVIPVQPNIPATITVKIGSSITYPLSSCITCFYTDLSSIPFITLSDSTYTITPLLNDFANL